MRGIMIGLVLILFGHCGYGNRDSFLDLFNAIEGSQYLNGEEMSNPYFF